MFGIGCEFGTSSVILKALHRRYAKAVTSFPGIKTQLPRSNSSRKAAGGKQWANNKVRNTAEDASPL